MPNFLSLHEEYVPMSLVHQTERRRKGETPYDTVFAACVNQGIPLKTTLKRSLRK